MFKFTAIIGVGAALFGMQPSAVALRFHSDMGSIKFEAQPGQVVNRSFRLTLEKGEHRTQFKVHCEDWWRSEDGSQSFYRPPGTLKRSCAPWIKLNPVETSVGPGETLAVRVSTAVPPDATAGGYWCALTLDEVLDPLKIKPEGVGVQVLASISVGVFVFVTPVERSARIVQVSVSHERAAVTVRDEGNCPLAVQGRFEFLKPGEQHPIVVVPLSRATLFTEPVETGIFSTALPDPTKLPNGKYLVRVILDIGMPHFIGAQKELDIARDAPKQDPAAHHAL